jgi:Aldo/keto reductase family
VPQDRLSKDMPSLFAMNVYRLSPTDGTGDEPVESSAWLAARNGVWMSTMFWQNIAGLLDLLFLALIAAWPISRAADAGAGVLVRGAVARGTASEDKNWTVQPLSSSGPPAQDRWEQAKLDELLEPGMSRHEFILRFTLSHPGVSSAIVGTGNPEHLRANVAAASRGPLPADVYAEAKGRLAAA